MLDNRKNRTVSKLLPVILMIFCLTLLILTAPQVVWAKEHPLGDIPMEPEIYKKFLKVQPMERATIALPDKYNASDEGIVTSAKDQGSCGSCWAFACTGAMESHVKREYNFGLTDLSEEQLLVCSGWGSCVGGYAQALYHWDTSNDGKGPNYEGDFPYNGNDNTPCTEDTHVQIPYRVVDFHSVRTTDDSGNPTVEYFKESLYVDGPSYWRFDVYTDFDTYWDNGKPGDAYTSGPNATRRGGHAVLLIGWDDSKGALLCKNSWGETGGPNGDGTFWISYSGHAKNLEFGMYNFGVVMVGCVSENCNNSIDDDCDGLVDCDDPDCDSDASCTVCGDGVCEGDETTESCKDDCFCENGTCDPGENTCTCSADCGGYPENETNCSDGVDNDCDGYVDCADTNCNQEVTCTCGDGKCLGDETCDNCPPDCVRSGGTCDTCFKGVCNGSCNPNKEGETCADCSPPACCGDGLCEGGESNENCPRDCNTFCGNGVCEGAENIYNCYIDCGCSDNADCNDNQPCTTDVCNDDGICANIWPSCGESDGCCGPECSPASDPDCLDCSACFKEICDGICHPKKDGPGCPDCQ